MSLANEWRQQLTVALGEQVTETHIEQTIIFLEMLMLWNKKHNMTRIAPADFVVRHIVESLSLLPYVDGKRFLDVGTGPGFPGLPLAIFATQATEVVLLDNAQKRCAFLTAVCQELGLNTVAIVCKNVLEYEPSPLFDIVVTRAFASLQKTVEWCEHAVADDGVIWAMKAQITAEEIAAISCPYEVIHTDHVSATRCLVQLKPRQNTGI
jgi:16S rRNA (guanine527-N7)-methyltransferase